jgi:hypothetical protein
MTDKKEQTYIDKSGWPDGEWKNEPDQVFWVDEATGYHCSILRSIRGGHLCGYVAVQKGHPLYGKTYSDIDLEIHGGLTYSEPCQGDSEQGICPATENNDKAWKFGFDCAHVGDFSPGREYLDLVFTGWDTYKNIAYVTAEVESLAKQLKRMEND